MSQPEKIIIVDGDCEYSVFAASEMLEDNQYIDLDGDIITTGSLEPIAWGYGYDCDGQKVRATRYWINADEDADSESVWLDEYLQEVDEGCES